MPYCLHLQKKSWSYSHRVYMQSDSRLSLVYIKFYISFCKFTNSASWFNLQPGVIRVEPRLIHLNRIICNLLTPYSRVLLEKLTGWQLVKKFPAFYGTRRFITAFTSVHHLSLSWASSIQSIPPNPTSWRSILILSSHLRLGLPSGSFPQVSPPKTLYTPLLSAIRATCPAHLIILDFFTRTILGEEL